jgi:hypothetical protein
VREIVEKRTDPSSTLEAPLFAPMTPSPRSIPGGIFLRRRKPVCRIAGDEEAA